MALRPLSWSLRAPINNLAEAKAFIEALHAEGLMWHFDDDPVDCLHETSPLVRREHAVLLGIQRDRLYDFEWGEFECPIGYALHIMKETDGDED